MSNMHDIVSHVFHTGGVSIVYVYPVIDSAIRVLSVGIAFLGAYMAIAFCEQYRLSKVGGSGKQKSKLLSQNGVFFLMSLAMGGVSTWARSFINLAGLSLVVDIGETNVYVDVNFLIIPAMLALFVSICLSFAGLYIGSKDEMFAKTKQEIVEKFVEHSSKLSFKEIQKITNLKMLFIISTQSIHNLVAGGIVFGSGTMLTVCLALYSIKIEHTNVVFNWGTVAGCMVLCWVFSVIAFWILFRLLSLYPHLEWLRIASAGLMALNLFILGLILYDSLVFHVITDFTPSPSAFRDTVAVSQSTLFSGTLVSAVCFAFALVMIALSDLRMWLYDKSAKFSSLEALVESLKNESPQNAELITCYMRKHAKVHSMSCDANMSSHHSGTESNVSSRRGKIVVSPWLHRLLQCFSGNTVSPDDSADSCIERAESSNHKDCNTSRVSSQIVMSSSAPSSPRRVYPAKDSLRIALPSHTMSEVDCGGLSNGASTKTSMETPAVRCIDEEQECELRAACSVVVP